MPTLNKAAIAAIQSAVDLVFDRLSANLFGPDWIHPRTDKNIFISFKPHLSLPGIYTLAAQEEIAKPNPEVLETLVHVANGYIESQRHATKAQVVQAVTSFVADAAKKGIKADLRTVLGKHLSDIFTKTQININKIVAAESNTAKNLGTLEGIVRTAALNNIADPTVAFIGPNDKDVCEECKKVLYTNYPIPKCFPLSQVKTGYFVRGETLPSMSGCHPICRHSLVYIHPGFGFDAGGHIKYYHKGFDALKSQNS
jgi:hypothetical protein